MLFITFCYTPDAAMLRMSANRIHHLDPKAIIYAVNDPQAPIKENIPGVRLLASSFPRGGNLNGLQLIAGELGCYRDALKNEKADYIVKFDCDMWLNDLEPFLRTEPQNGQPVPDFLVPERHEAFKPIGGIYRLSKWAVDALIADFNRRSREKLWQSGNLYPEDQTLWNMALQSKLVCQQLPYVSGFCRGHHDEAPGESAAWHSAGVVHCGEPLNSGERVSREHATLRMKLVKHYFEHGNQK